jgi:hypothetical protein
LATGEFVRVAFDAVPGQADQLEQLGDAVVAVLARMGAGDVDGFGDGVPIRIRGLSEA